MTQGAKPRRSAGAGTNASASKSARAREVGAARTAAAEAPPDFRQRVLSVVRRIPVGRVATYGDVAALAGRPRAARAVGNIMRTCGRPDVPCHRVVGAGGRLGGFAGREPLKRALLAAEGVEMSGARISLARCRWRRH
ncbi:MAG: MGMT family protein [Vicinamibacterales bacterium]